MLILVNRSSNGGRGAARWERVERALRERGTRFEAHETASVERAEELVASTTHRVIVAAGGDGTANGVLNALVRLRPDATLGAIGLGSSNDFHKPFNERIEEIPVRLDVERSSLVDVGMATFTGEDGVERVRYFCLNASVGVVADGNAFFNTDDPTLLWLKRRNVDLAIAYTAFVNLMRLKPVTARIALDDEPAWEVCFASLAILKKVHFAGGMRYDTPVTPDDGFFDVNLWGRTGRLSALRTLASLSRGRFRELPGAQCWRARAVRLDVESPVNFELDGEVSRVTSAKLVVVPRALRVCA